MVRGHGATPAPLADHDFAVYLVEPSAVKRFDIRLRLMAVLVRELNTERVDVRVLNDVKGPEFKYAIIKEGILLFERETCKVLVEPRILSEYFDFQYWLVKNNVTRNA
ncbi:MAG: nucleotidyltransferase domain-containing protein [Chloroflexi bacterium]|nr:nucleotidyltransferase domain-containing protein [Chloroflexota bacterium]